MPSTISSSTTSYRPVSTRRCAVVPPTLPAPMTVIFSRPTGILLLFPSPLWGEGEGEGSSPQFITLTLPLSLQGRGVKLRLVLVVFVRGPAGHLKIDRTHEILAQIEVELDFLLSVMLRQELLRILDQFLVHARLVLPQLDEADDHPGLDLLQDLEPALGKDFPELGLDLVGRGLLTFLPRPDVFRKFRLPPNVGIGMARKELVEPLGDSPLAGIRIHQVVNAL